MGVLTWKDLFSRRRFHGGREFSKGGRPVFPSMNRKTIKN